jgi:hypothetical protein
MDKNNNIHDTIYIISRIIFLISIVVCLICTILLYAYAFNHPDITQIQLYILAIKKYWVLYLITIASCIISTIFKY